LPNFTFLPVNLKAGKSSTLFRIGQKIKNEKDQIYKRALFYLLLADLGIFLDVATLVQYLRRKQNTQGRNLTLALMFKKLF